MWYAYVLESAKNGRFYVGYTSDLRQRFSDHNSGRGGKYSRGNGPFRLVFYEAYTDKLDAIEAEKFLKTGYGREVFKKKIKNYLSKKLMRW